MRESALAQNALTWCSLIIVWILIAGVVWKSSLAKQLYTTCEFKWPRFVPLLKGNTRRLLAWKRATRANSFICKYPTAVLATYTRRLKLHQSYTRHLTLHQPCAQCDVVTECYINHEHNVMSSLNTSTIHTMSYRHWMLHQPWTQRHIVTECYINYEHVISSLNAQSTMNTTWYRH